MEPGMWKNFGALLDLVHRLVWGPGLLVLMLGAGILYTVKSRGFQIFGWKIWWRATIGGGERDFRTACTALAATIGTGNIVGVATALKAGGPGAIFWMWISALLGMMTGYAEVWLGIHYRHRNERGTWICGDVSGKGIEMSVAGGGVRRLLSSSVFWHGRNGPVQRGGADPAVYFWGSSGCWNLGDRRIDHGSVGRGK